MIMKSFADAIKLFRFGGRKDISIEKLPHGILWVDLPENQNSWVDNSGNPARLFVEVKFTSEQVREVLSDLESRGVILRLRDFHSQAHVLEYAFSEGFLCKNGAEYAARVK